MLFRYFLRKKNKGYSLVEVVVAMLILAIITIPLLTSLNVVTKANLNTREKQYAGNVASNVLEAVKQYGIAESAIQMHSSRGDASTQTDFNFFPADSGLTYGECLKDFTTVIKFGTPVDDVKACIEQIALGQFKFSPRMTNTALSDGYNNDYARKYYFFINNIKEGTMTFDAHITFDATTTEYQSAENTLNNFKLADLSSLNSKRTAVISPSGVWYTLLADNDENYDTSKTFESEALRVFEERYREYMNTSYTAEKERVNSVNELVDDAIRAYINNAISQSDLYYSDGFAKDQYFNYILKDWDLPGFDADDDEDYLEDYVKKTATVKDQIHRDVTEADLAHAEELRKLAFDYYIANYPGAYATYADRGYVLKTVEGGETVYANHKEPDTVKKRDPMHIEGQPASIVDGEFISNITRTTYIVITLDAGRYVVNSTTLFEFEQGNTALLCDTDDPDRRDELTYTCEGYYTNMAFETIENIYLFQDAARAGTYKKDTIYFDYLALGDNCIEYDGEEVDVGFYVVWQYWDGTPIGATEEQKQNRVNELMSLDTKDVEFICAGSRKQMDRITVYKTGKPTLRYFNRPIPGTEPLLINSSDGSEGLVADSKNSDRAYTVTISIYRHDTGELLVTEKSAIKE